MEKRSILASLLLLVVGLQTVRAQGFRVYKSDGTVAQFSLRTDSIVFYDGIGTDQDFGPFMPVNQCIVGTWYKSKNEVIIFNENGTTNYMEGATYEFFPYQGTVIISNASGAPISYFKVLKVTEEQMIVAMPGSEKLSIYSTKPVQFVTGITLSETFISLQPDESKRLTATVVPADADNPAVTWTSSNEAVAEVISNGLVVAVAAGNCTITCAATDGSGVKAECQVNVGNLDNEITFNIGTKASTRADLYGGDAAAEKLQNQFIVYGTKHAAAEDGTVDNDEVVFKNYKVEYTANSAGHTTSNTNNWEYVGLTPYAAAKVSPAATQQAIKFWDYSAENGYTFYGIASKADIETNNKITITKTTSGSTVYDKGYSVVIKSGADLDKLFVADRTPVAKADYNKPVTLKFRNFGTRVRVGFYETIPGYTVTINKFYTDADAGAVVTSFTPMVDPNETNFAAALQNVKTDPGVSGNTVTVSYYNGTNGPENQVKLTNSTVEYNYALTLGTGVVGTVLNTSSATPTWDKTAGAYTTVYPFEANINPMLVKVDYTLTAEDGSGETIVVQGANAVVPVEYVKWKSNFAYTYIFKIAPNTNGTTDGTVQGLYPITFDAVVVDVADDKTQETITNFEDNSVTTYANGSKVTENNEYKVGKAIYVVKTNNATGGVIAPAAIGSVANNALVYTATTGGDAISEATVKAKLTGSPNGITLAPLAPAATLVADGKVPAADETNYEFGSNGAVTFTPAAAGTYVYVFTRTAYVAPTYTAVGEAAFAPATTYYFKTGDNVYYPAAGINAENFAANKASLYTLTDAGTAGEYDIKVIKVVA